MTISLFSGQGSQYEGMGRDIAEAMPELLSVYETGSDILGTDLKKICFKAPLDELSRTINSQPAIMATSIVCLKAAQSKGFVFDGVAGHSLGEYAAMYASGMITLEDAFRLIKARAAAMEEATASAKGAMAAIMKIAPEEVERVCGEAENYVTAVNYNSPVQTVIAGTPEGIAEVSDIFAEMKARVIPLNVAGAFHSQLMQPAADKFYETAKTISFKAPEVKYYSNLTGGELTDFSDMASMLAKHIVSPVRFTSELTAMQEAGADRFVEFGPGRTLTGLVKKTLKDVTAVNVENLETLEGVLS
ncbi:ACP S-malonyltransferase [Ruminococcus flavefaciens]|uniref:Malonyl CoA-acyl carrier protein transacylase n=1 Tax=Ruminococcus flavefaciens 007c TaxID=1341157 RepID=W7UH39_RUMFL|nr:ACP S-malonyltransferase [Ruminococcus flavefaciens]EWM53258.1 malonyl CoA-acyl carrier protein transacylase [Ruminococcus flavefaciens 007c]